jgi:hypothetical protein
MPMKKIFLEKPTDWLLSETARKQLASTKLHLQMRENPVIADWVQS